MLEGIIEEIRVVTKEMDKTPLVALPEILICIVCRFYKQHNEFSILLSDAVQKCGQCRRALSYASFGDTSLATNFRRLKIKTKKCPKIKLFEIFTVQYQILKKNSKALAKTPFDLRNTLIEFELFSRRCIHKILRVQ